MNLDLVSQFPEQLVDVELFFSGLLARSLELDQEETPIRKPEDPVRVARLAWCCEFGTQDSQLMEDSVTDLLLDRDFKHQNLQSFIFAWL